MGESGRDVSGEGARDGEPDDGERFNRDLKLSRMVDLDGKRKKLFFWPDMLVASNVQRNTHSTAYYPGPSAFPYLGGV